MKIFVLLCAIFPAVALAKDLGCGFLNIFIQNYTGSPCYLAHADVVEGSLISDLPQMINHTEQSANIFMQQGYLSGPSLLLEYQCGERHIQLFSHQELCFLGAGEISGDAYTSDNNHAKYSYLSGSYWSSRPGTINWVIF